MRGKAALKGGNYRKALALAEHGLRMEMDDPDLHLLHAEALEAKLNTRSIKTRRYFKRWSKSGFWFTQQVGEKGMDVKGISVLRGFYSDEERGMEAKRHFA